MDLYPQLYTKRLTLRKLQIDDVPALVKYANNQKITDRITNMNYPYREPDAVFRIGYVIKGFKNKTHYAFSIILDKQKELIGGISLHLLDRKNYNAELGYWIGEPFWGQGITTEATAAILKFGFEKANVGLIQATCNLDNKASEKVLLNNGMTKHTVNGNLMLYKITKEEYEAQQSGI